MTRPAFRLIALAAAPIALMGTTASAQPGSVYRAVGTEPFWSVTIGNGRMVYEDAERRRVVVPTPRPVYPRYTGRIYETPRMVVRIRRAPCSDGMSDHVYEDRVEVRVDGRRLEGCGGAFTEPSRIANTHWRISAINGRAVPADGGYRLDFTEARLSGRAGCNGFSGSYSLAGNVLRAGPVAATRMACPPPRMAEEQAVLGLLSQPLRVTQGDEHGMTLTGRTGSLRLELVPGERPRSR